MKLKMKIGTKLYASFFTILVFLLGVGLIGINSSKQIDVAVEGLVSHEIPAVIY